MSRHKSCIGRLTSLYIIFGGFCKIWLDLEANDCLIFLGNTEELRISWAWSWGHLAFHKYILQEEVADYPMCTAKLMPALINLVCSESVWWTEYSFSVFNTGKRSDSLLNVIFSWFDFLIYFIFLQVCDRKDNLNLKWGICFNMLPQCTLGACRWVKNKILGVSNILRTILKWKAGISFSGYFHCFCPIPKPREVFLFYVVGLDWALP